MLMHKKKFFARFCSSIAYAVRDVVHLESMVLIPVKCVIIKMEVYIHQ